jgi:poly(A) polymerase
MDNREAAARKVCARLRDAAHTAYLAGGCVRDLLLGLPPQDYDVATSATPDEVTALFPRTAPVGAAFGVVLVLTDAAPIEVATFRNDGPYLDGRHPSSVSFSSPEEDARRRDFTINALFLDPATNEILDYVGGRADLEARIIRAVGNPDERFQEDHLRLLRAVRFSARLGYPIEPKTLNAMRLFRKRIHRTSPERVRDELLKMLTEAAAADALTLLDETGLLQEVLPEVSAMKGVPQPPEYHPEGDVFVHTLLVQRKLNRPTPALALGALLHDCGKPPTYAVSDRIRFNRHDEVGAEMALAVCERLRLPKRDTAHIVWLVREHMHLAHVPKMREAKRKRYIRQPGFDDLIELCRADCLASHGDLSIIKEILDYLEQLPPEGAHPPRLLTGDDLLALGYPPGPKFRELLSAIEDAQLEGTIATREEALAWLKAIPCGNTTLPSGGP